MGQVLQRIHDIEKQEEHINKPNNAVTKFQDLQNLPPEIGLAVLSHLNATDLCLAACVWDTLANDEILWMGLCKDSWGYASIYKYIKNQNFSFKKLYMILDEASLTFNCDAFEGEDYLFKHGLVENSPMEIAKFLHFTKKIRPIKKREYLNKRRDVLDKLVHLQNFEKQFLPNALRNLFGTISAPEQRGDLLTEMIEKFSARFCSCNPNLGFSKDTIFVLCFSLIMLSVDLTSPAVKNKMSKREFIKNTKRAALGVDEDFAGHLYDNIYLIGHIAREDS